MDRYFAILIAFIGISSTVVAKPSKQDVQYQIVYETHEEIPYIVRKVQVQNEEGDGYQDAFYDPYEGIKSAEGNLRQLNRIIKKDYLKENLEILFLAYLDDVVQNPPRLKSLMESVLSSPLPEFKNQRTKQGFEKLSNLYGYLKLDLKRVAKDSSSEIKEIVKKHYFQAIEIVANTRMSFQASVSKNYSVPYDKYTSVLTNMPFHELFVLQEYIFTEVAATLKYLDEIKNQNALTLAQLDEYSSPESFREYISQLKHPSVSDRSESLKLKLECGFKIKSNTSKNLFQKFGLGKSFDKILCDRAQNATSKVSPKEIQMLFKCLEAAGKDHYLSTLKLTAKT